MIRQKVQNVLKELLRYCPQELPYLVVFAASTSQILGKPIGTKGSPDVAQVLVEGILEVQAEYGFSAAFQACEHLNRALVTEKETARLFQLTIVSAVPSLHAGGAFATEAYHQLKRPCVVESIQASAGIDIGGTFIGMHLKPVAVPITLSNSFIGKAKITAAYTRPKLIGGSRTIYFQRGE